MDRRKENKKLYELKAICAYLVVLLHCNFPGKIGIIFEVLARIAVPCFFMISGYFSYPYNKEKIKLRIISMLRLIISVEIIYLLLLFGTCDFGELIINKYCSFIALSKLFCFSVYGSFGAGWYLYAMLGIYLLFYIRGGGIKSSGICLGLLIVHILVQHILKLNDVKCDYYTSNIWLMGIPFFYLGMMCKYNIGNQIKRISLIALFVVGIVLSLMQRWLFFSSDLYVGTILSAYSIFAYCLLETKTRSGALVRIGKLYAKSIYIMHLVVLTIINSCEMYFDVTDSYIFLKPVIVCTVTTLLAMICHYAGLMVR